MTNHEYLDFSSNLAQLLQKFKDHQENLLKEEEERFKKSHIYKGNLAFVQSHERQRNESNSDSLYIPKRKPTAIQISPETSDTESHDFENVTSDTLTVTKKSNQKRVNRKSSVMFSYRQVLDQTFGKDYDNHLYSTFQDRQLENLEVVFEEAWWEKYAMFDEDTVPFNHCLSEHLDFFIERLKSSN